MLLRMLPALLLALAAPSLAHGQNLETEPSVDFSHGDLQRLDTLYDRLFDTIDPHVGETLYRAYHTGLPIVHGAFLGGTPETQLHILQRTAAFIARQPRYGELFDRDAAGAPKAADARRMTIDSGPLPRSASLRAHRVLPMEQGGQVAIASADAQQFGLLLSTMVRLAAKRTPPPGQQAAWRAALRQIHDFVASDTLRLYWLELPAWHWSGAYPNVRARTLARLDGEPRLETRKFFRAFIDYDLHVLAIGADLVATYRDAPWLARPGDSALANDVFAIARRVLLERADLGPDGRGFGFDRGLWGDNPVAAYALCRDPLPPARECRWNAYVEDVSHGQRWPVWLDSFGAAAKGTPFAARVAAWRAGLARELAEKVIHFDASGRPLMTNFLDGNDGWYLFTGTGPGGSGSRPTSLTGWSMRYGAWALLGAQDVRIRNAYRRFCDVIASTTPADVKFRTEHYGAPGANPANGFMSTRDEYGPDSYYVLPCRIYQSLKM